MTQSKICLQRIKQLQKVHPDLFLVKDPFELYYLTGLELSLGYLFLSKKGATLFVDGRYLEVAEKKSPTAVVSFSEENIVSFLKGNKQVLFDENKLNYSDFLFLKKLARKAKLKVKAEKGILDPIRAIKDSSEIRLMKSSAELNYKAYQYIRKKLTPGITELELATLLKIYCLKQGASSMSFEPIVAFGKNSSLPHHHPSKTKLKENDIALFDLGVVLGGYASDMTRVDFVGKPDTKLKEIHDVNKAAQRMALSKCRPGVKLKELDIAARRVMKSARLEEFYVHSLGHGIGLEVHEYPRVGKSTIDKNLVLEPGMAITIEPGIYLPGKGGVRYEDTIIITENGYINLYPE